MVKLYILEDEHTMSDILGDFFKSQNFEVVSSREGTGAAEAILSAQPDLLLLDQLLPGKTGLEVLGELREQGFNKPVILFTNNPVESLDDEGLKQLGVTASFTKSNMTLPDLSNAILRYAPRSTSGS